MPTKTQQQNAQQQNARIKKLSPLLINQLAAGEVVARPASVIKELLENSIDAGATQIDIHLSQGGISMMKVTDNGMGIHPDDMIMAVTRHATSKVADVANLQGIDTLGFRGEALASMAAVSRLTLISSNDQSGIGRQLNIAGVLNDTPNITPVLHQQGTTVIVKDLYFNVPARRGNLKSIATEFAHIETIVKEIALSYANVSIALYHEQKLRLSLNHQPDHQNPNLQKKVNKNRLEQILGEKLPNQTIELAIDLNALFPKSPNNSPHLSTNKNAQITGWLWLPETDHHQSKKYNLLYINGRLIKDDSIAQQLRQISKNLDIEQLNYALYFELPNHCLNVNIHPNKQRIKIHDLTNILAHLNHEVKNKLQNLKRINGNNIGINYQQDLNKNTYQNNVPKVSELKNEYFCQKNIIDNKEGNLANSNDQFTKNNTIIENKNYIENDIINQNDINNHIINDNSDVNIIKQDNIIQCLMILEKPTKSMIEKSHQINIKQSNFPYCLIMVNDNKSSNISQSDSELMLISWKALSDIYQFTENINLNDKESINKLLNAYFKEHILQKIKQQAIKALTLEDLLLIMIKKL